ncbi:Atu4866 domain-containing protein [Verrucosispora sp. NA02020]|nr:Atu4866 domain-containing protein [Verrucosispora sp. NA02020]
MANSRFGGLFSADGTFDGDVLHHAGYVFYREGSDAHRQARTDG